MQRTKKKLQLSRETVRALSGNDLSRVAGGISGLRICHSIDDICHRPNTETLCNASNDTQCVSGLMCG